MSRDEAAVQAIADAVKHALRSMASLRDMACIIYDAAGAAGMLPHRTSDEGTGYCPLAEDAEREVERLRAGLRGIADRFDPAIEPAHRSEHGAPMDEAGWFITQADFSHAEDYGQWKAQLAVNKIARESQAMLDGDGGE